MRQKHIAITAFLVALFSSAILSIQAETISATLQRQRENPVRKIMGNSVLEYYCGTRFLDIIDTCASLELVPVSPSEKILYLLSQGNCYLLGPQKLPDRAYTTYLKALSEIRVVGDKILQVEVLRNLIRYCLFTTQNLHDVQVFVSDHGDLAYDRLELLWNKYYQLRLADQIDRVDSKVDHLNSEAWQVLMQECIDSNYLRLLTEVRLVYAVQLGLGGDPVASIKLNTDAMTSAAKFSRKYQEAIQFVTISNIGAAKMVMGDFAAALRQFQQALTLQITRQRQSNQSRVYLWLADCYKNLDQLDSAYYFLDLSYQVDKENAEEQHTVAIKEIQSRYDNERLGRALLEESLKRKQNNLTAFSIGGGLLFISLFIWFHYYRQRQKNQEISQDLEMANKEIQLTAVNARLDGQEQEKKNLASYLHDHIVGQLVAANMHLKIAGKNRDGESIQKSAQLVHDAGIQLRNKSHDLYPPVLLKLGLGPALEDLCKKYTSPLLHFNINPKASEIRITGDSSTKVYFSVQELLNNVTKHSQASQCKVVAEIKGDHLFIEIEDNGLGLQTNGNPGEGLGINTVRSRIETLGGSFSIQPASTHGLRQEISVPLASLTA